MSERITIQTIERKKFTLKGRGYDKTEVDQFLDAICDELERMEKERESLKQELAAARAAQKMAQETRPVETVPLAKPAPVQAPAPAPRPAPAPAPAPAQAPLATNAELIDVLQLANRLKDETVAAARQKAEEILAEADKQAKERLGAVAVERETLTKEVETLRTNVKNYRERFTAMLREQQEALDRLTL